MRFAILFIMALCLIGSLAYVPNRIASRSAFSRILVARQATTTSTSGAAGTETFRVFFQEDGKTISPWHDIPLKAGAYYNFINEIPK